LKPGFPEALWNISSVEKTIEGAEHWIDQCLMVDANHVSAKLTKAALRFYQGDKDNFFNLMQSEFKEHPYMRSFFGFSANLIYLLYTLTDGIFLTQSLSKVYAQDLFMNSVCGGQQLSNTLLSILKKAMVLIRIQACQTIGMTEMVVLR